MSGFASGQSAQSGAPTSSGSFTNLQSYLNANADQAQGLGAKIEDNVQNTANAGRTDLSNAQKEFNTQIDQAGIDRNAASSAALGNIVNKAYSNPTALQDSDYGLFSNVENKQNTFEGTAPKDLNSNQNYQNADAKFGQAADQANLTGSEGGRQQLLKQTFARPSYSQGQSSLDQLLTQNAPENRQRFEKLRSGLLGDSGLVSEENKAIQSANEKRTNASNDLTSANQDIQDYLFNPNNKQEMGTFQQALDSRLQGSPVGSNIPQTALYGPSSVDANGNPLPQDVQMNKYGVLTQAEQQAQDLVSQLKARQAANLAGVQTQYQNRQNAEQLLGADLSSAVQKASNFDPTLANSLTPDEFARIQALNKLAGRDPGTIGNSVINLASQRFDPTVSMDQVAADKIIADKANQFKADIGNSLAETDNSNFVPAIPNNVAQMSLPQAHDWMESFIQQGYPNIDTNTYVNPEIDHILTAYKNQVDQLNTLRGKYGLPPLDVNNFYDGGSKKAAVDNLVKGAVDQSRSTVPVDLNNPEVPRAMGQAAYFEALQRVIDANKQQMANPTQKMTQGTGASPNPGGTITKNFLD